MAKLSRDTKAEPNVTAVIGVVYILITFFLLQANFKSAEVDLSLRLPVVGSARPVETHGQRGLLVLNIDKEGSLRIYGRPIQDLAGYIASEAHVARLAARIQPAVDGVTPELPTTIVIRADRATPFKMINRIITECQKNGFRRFALKAKPKES